MKLLLTAKQLNIGGRVGKMKNTSISNNDAFLDSISIILSEYVDGNNGEKKSIDDYIKLIQNDYELTRDFDNYLIQLLTQSRFVRAQEAVWVYGCPETS
jgi:hypothetical protein